jgi:rRNA-processing protein EBP2
MAKNRKQRRSSLKAAKEVQEEQHNDVDMADKVDDDDDTGDQITLAKIDAMSDSEEEDEAAEWDAEAQALRKAISEGAFEKLNLKSFKDGGGKEVNNDDGEETGGPVALEDDSSSDEEEDKNEEEKVEGPKSNSTGVAQKALQSVTNGLVSIQKAMPWPETMDIVPSTPLPFGTVNEEGVLIQVHDDLKREVVFYNMALEAVHEARVKCDENNIPFTRPEDFFAEMVKTDGTFIASSSFFIFILNA